MKTTDAATPVTARVPTGARRPVRPDRPPLGMVMHPAIAARG